MADDPFLGIFLFRIVNIDLPVERFYLPLTSVVIA